MRALALLAALVFPGCVRLPVRVDSQIQGPGGAGTFADMGKIKPGKSTREDVLRDWEWCNAHLDSNRLFVGKVVHSKTKNIDMMGPIYMGSEGRQWDDENLFVEFDDKGTVTKAYLGSHRDFLRQISSWVRQTELPPLDL